MNVKHLKWGRLVHASLYPEDHGYILSILANIHARASLLSKTQGLIYHSVYGSSYGSGGRTAMCRLWEALQVELAKAPRGANPLSKWKSYLCT